MRSSKKSLFRSTHRNNYSRATLHRSLSLQTLEDRCVLAAAVLDGGTVTVHAGDADNEIGVWANGEINKLFIKVDDTTLEFDNDLVSHINIYAEGGNDSISIRNSVTQTTLLDGGDGNDRIIGSQQRDAILGGGGNDRIHGRDGNDRIDGGEGNDQVHGGNGDDGLQGGIGDDTLYGDAGNDTILGDPPMPVEVAETDDEGGLRLAERAHSDTDASALNAELVDSDEAISPSFNDVIYGGDGDDVIRSGPGHDVVFAGQGNDAVSGGAGNDYIEGGDGNDRLSGDSGGDIIFGGAGHDSLGGGDGNDYLIGGSGHDVLLGGVGDDYLKGGDGTDVLFGGEGRDKIDALDGQFDFIFADVLDGIEADEFDLIVYI